MTLDNLLGIGRLKAHKTSRVEVSRLVASAEVSLRDAQRPDLGNGSRLDLAYKAIMQAALAALYANGFRPSTSEPGHQQTTIQTLPKTIGLAADRMTVLDNFRRARNLADYEGADVCLRAPALRRRAIFCRVFPDTRPTKTVIRDS